MSFSNENSQLPPDLSKLSLYTQSSPAAVGDATAQHDTNGSTLDPALKPGAALARQEPSPASAANSPIYHGLPNMNADLQARVLAFQEKRQAAVNQHDQLHLLQQDPQHLQHHQHHHQHHQHHQHHPHHPQHQQNVSHLISSQADHSQLPPPTTTTNATRPQINMDARKPHASPTYSTQKSPEKASPSSSNSKKIAPPLRLPPSLPPHNSPTSISQPILQNVSPQQLARLPRSRPSLSQRRGMKLNVSDLTKPDPDTDSQQQPKSATGSSFPASKMVTSSATPSARSGSGTSNLDTKKKPVLEFIGKRGQLSSQQQQPKLQGLFLNYSKYVDIKSGSLNFSGKLSLHSKGVDFSGGCSFRISIDELEFIEELGRGNYGTVSKVLHKPTNIVMAMKEVRLELDDSKFRQILMELEVLHKCDSDYIVEFYGAFFVEGAVYMCIEYMNLGSLDKVYAEGIPEPQLAYILKCVIRGLKQLKDDQNIIHRDVKPTNILINDQGKIKLCDFGVSGNLVMSMARTNIGCQSYMAPERIKSLKPDDVSYSVQSDVWSLGLSLLEVAQGQYPLVSENIFAQLKQIVEDDPPQLPAGKFSKELNEFINLCLVKDPQTRSTYQELLDHAWLLKYPDDKQNELDLKDYLAHKKFIQKKL